MPVNAQLRKKHLHYFNRSDKKKGDNMRIVNSIYDLTCNEIEEIVDFGIYYKHNYKNYLDACKGKTLLMLFEKTSTRTRVSFESGFSKMGGHAIYLNYGSSNIVLSELKDEIRYIERNSDIIMARLKRNDDFKIISDNVKIPVINGCCNLFHPCQVLADLMTIKEKFGTIHGIKLAYIGNRTNVSNDLASAVLKFGGTFSLVPNGIFNGCQSSDEKFVIEEQEKQLLTKGFISSDDLETCIQHSDIVYTDSWINMEDFNDSKKAEENKKIIEKYLPYQLNHRIFNANSNITVMHDMPMHIDYEITRDVIESENSIIFDQAENRMWAQNALMLILLNLKN